MSLRFVLPHRYGVCEDKDYKQWFGRRDFEDDEDINKLFLWEVTLHDKTKVMVLAQTPELAIGQATCTCPHDYEKGKLLGEGAVATQVPYRIQGWSHQTFN